METKKTVVRLPPAGQLKAGDTLTIINDTSGFVFVTEGDWVEESEHTEVED